MKRLAKNKVNIQYKLLTIFSLVFILPLIIFGVISYTNFENILQDNAFKYNMEKLRLVQTNVESFFDDLEIQVRGIEADYVFNSRLGKKEEDYEKTIEYIKNNEYIYNKLSNIIIQNKKLISLYLYTDSGMSYCVNFDDSIDPYYSPADEDWYQMIMKSANGSSILSTRIDKQTASKTSEVIPYICPIHATVSPDSKNVKAIVQFNINLGMMGSFMETSEVKGTSYLLVNKDGRILYNDRKYLGNFEQNMLNMMQDNSGQEIYQTSKGEKMLLGFKKIGNLGWYAVSMTNNAKLMEDTNSYKTVTFVFTLGVLILFIFLSIGISTGISRPIKSMEKIISEIERGHTQTKYDVKVDNNSGLLREHYVHFVDTINKLIKELNFNMEKRQEQEILILQSQINPHFIYNTLNTVKWLAKMEGNVRIEEAVSSLINLLKSAIKVGQNYISIDEEIKQIEAYIKIQKLRYDDNFEVKIDVENQVKFCKTIKFMLQPIVENAIFHGVDIESAKGLIHIDIKKVNENIVYLVKDNGEGMTKGKVERLLSGSEKPTGMTGIGIKNVNERIKNTFGAEYGIKIDSQKDRGTEVRIIIPATLFEDGDGNEDSNC